MVEIKIERKRFVDVDFSFKKHPSTNDVVKKTNELAIIAAIKNLVLTKLYGRPFHPELSSQVHDLLFEPLTAVTASTLKRSIKYVIDNFEPRVELLLVNVKDSADLNAIDVTIVFNIIGFSETVTTQFFLQRML
jgi:phage baseplate assembly protein W